jgi:hypothetical protein
MADMAQELRAGALSEFDDNWRDRQRPRIRVLVVDADIHLYGMVILPRSMRRFVQSESLEFRMPRYSNPFDAIERVRAGCAGPGLAEADTARSHPRSCRAVRKAPRRAFPFTYGAAAVILGDAFEDSADPSYRGPLPSTSRRLRALSSTALRDGFCGLGVCEVADAAGQASCDSGGPAANGGRFRLRPPRRAAY